MKSLCLYLATLVLFAANLNGQTEAAHRSNSQIVEFVIGIQEKAVLGIAEAMPAEKYSFAPGTKMGEFRGVRTFGEQLRHIAVDNYLFAAAILGEKPAADLGNIEAGENGPAAVVSKADIIAYVKNSFAQMHRAAPAIDDANAVLPTPGISPWPEGTATRLGLALEDVVHTYDHYGQLVEYLRMNGIVPPGSAQPPTVFGRKALPSK